MRRHWLYVALTVLVAGASLFGVPRLRGGFSRMLTSEEAITQTAAVLGAPRAQMQATAEPILSKGGRFFQKFVVAGKHITVQAPAPDSFSLRWEDEEETHPPLDRNAEAVRRVDMVTAQQTAEALVRSRFPDMSSMRLTQALQLAMGPYMFVWQQVTSYGAVMGNGAHVFVDCGTGHILSYTERRLPQSVRSPRPRISREEADRLARSVLETQVGKGRDIRLDDAKSGLVLNSPVSPSGGPAWELSYVDETIPQVGYSPLHLIVIDAVTGKDIAGGMVRAPTGGGR